VGELPYVDFGRIDPSKAIDRLNWQPTSLREGIEQTLAWYFDDEENQHYHEHFNGLEHQEDSERQVTFKNHWTTHAAHVYWVDEEGSTILNAVIEPAESVVVGTYVGHTFEIWRAGGKRHKLEHTVGDDGNVDSTYDIKQELADEADAEFHSEL
jgi:hypothetical protein